MNEREVNKTNQDLEKLKWEAPKLYCLDKSDTEGGPGNSYEDFSSAPS